MLGDRLYNIDYTKLTRWLLPPFLRQVNTLLILDVCIGQVNFVYNLFIAHVNYLIYWEAIDSQVWRMEKALNDKYDIALRRIRIVDAAEQLAVPLYQVEENKPLTLYKNKTEHVGQVFYTKAETGSFTSDFIVTVPADIVFTQTEMRAFIDTFKTPSKTYSISIQ